MIDPSRHILALTRKPDSASFEQRVLHYIEPLAGYGVQVTWKEIPQRGREINQLLKEAGGYDGVWLHRYLFPLTVARRWQRAIRRLVFDFDDPLTFTAREGGRPSLGRRLKFAATIRRCDGVLAASQHLASLARPYHDGVTVLPMAVDLPEHTLPAPRNKPPGEAELLWVGSKATMPYLEIIRPALEQLARQQPNVRLRLVAHEPMNFGPMTVDYRPWSYEAQDAALRECDIGLCPMPDTVWTRGKCPYKVLQYMAHAKPWVGAAVGENLIAAGQDRGLCAANESQWLDHLVALVDEPTKRHTMGQAGFTYIQQYHERGALTRCLTAFWKGS